MNRGSLWRTLRSLALPAAVLMVPPAVLLIQRHHRHGLEEAAYNRARQAYDEAPAKHVLLFGARHGLAIGRPLPPLFGWADDAIRSFARGRSSALLICCPRARDIVSDMRTWQAALAERRGLGILVVTADDRRSPGRAFPRHPRLGIVTVQADSLNRLGISG